MGERNPLLGTAKGTETADLAAFAAGVGYEAIPGDVIARITELFVDWVGSALSGKGQRPILALERYADAMGPADGPAEILTSGRRTSPVFAATVNAAASHISEQDDVHNGSVFHPAAVVFPAALATAQALGASGRDLLTASVAGYEVGVRVGEFLGRSHYTVFHTTGTAGALAAAAATGRLLGLDAAAMLHAFGSAGTQAAGLWEFLRDAADSKQLHTAKAAENGLIAAWLAKDGFTGAKRILEGKQGLAAGTSSDADPLRLLDRLGVRWAVTETSFKFHASCRHTHPTADALLRVIERHDLKPADIAGIVAHVHQGAIDVLGAVSKPRSVHQAKFSMGATLGLVAVRRCAGLAEFAQVLEDDEALSFIERTRMVLDPEVDSAYPARWIGKVTVSTIDGRELRGRVDEPKGDPGNTLSRDEIETKFRSLALSGDAVRERELGPLLDGLWRIGKIERVETLLSSHMEASKTA
ncbi:MmgE/PrpD family protein [Chelativorans sp. AA-79]|uniref:MmgE/PrpD family protein n=1 Tax=Chelativorans sp. AA-79 TaxID=3028735 RepID=UPI0023F6BAFC|nr:MmgE/PrpD family protein [Chelativorans sp. AA-79]WEX08073.1 MmgE/PrpD family protein [Chelativorans sp. AA-79]